jgi:hypothetical protein
LGDLIQLPINLFMANIIKHSILPKVKSIFAHILKLLFLIVIFSQYGNAQQAFEYYQKGKIKLDQGNYAEASLIFQEACKYAKDEYGDNTVEYSIYLNYLALSSFYGGKFIEAEEYFIDILEILEPIKNSYSVDYCTTSNNLATLYIATNRYNKAYHILQNLCDYEINDPTLKNQIHNNFNVIKSELNVDFPCMDSDNLNPGNLDQKIKTASDYYSNGSFRKSIILLQEILGENNSGINESLKNKLNLYMASSYLELNKIDSALFIYNKLYSGIDAEKYPKDYIEVLNDLTIAYYKKNNNDLVKKIYYELNDFLFRYIDYNSPFMTDEEKHEVLEQFNSIKDRFLSYAIDQLHNDNTFKKYLVEFSDKYKNILIRNTSRKIKTHSPELKKIDEYIKNLNDTLSTLYFSNPELIKQSGYSISEYQYKKFLSFKKEHLTVSDSEEYKKNHELNLNSIFDKMNPNSVFVDIIRVKQNNNFLNEGNICYLFLIIEKGAVQPNIDYLILRNGDELEGKYYSHYMNIIRSKGIKDEISYSEYWEKINEKIHGYNNIYISADGIYNLLNIEVMQDDNDRYILDDKNIIRLVSLSGIIEEENSTESNSPDSTKEIALFGYPDYNRGYKKTSYSSGNDYSRFLKNIDNLQLLPGTKEEITEIEKILEKNTHFKVETFLDTNACESNIKRIKSPYILHLSTHGFYKNLLKYNLNYFDYYDRLLLPYLRSGIVLSDVKASFNRKYLSDRLEFGIEDGILTGFEIQNMDLENTSLVVLSACKTAQGELLENSQGVYGLQRAFYQAGVRSLLMTLWDVDDRVTKDFMIQFYESYVKTRNYNSALLEAKRIFRKKYADPYYWGAFIILTDA